MNLKKAQRDKRFRDKKMFHDHSHLSEYVLMVTVKQWYRLTSEHAWPHNLVWPHPGQNGGMIPRDHPVQENTGYPDKSVNVISNNFRMERAPHVHISVNSSPWLPRGQTPPASQSKKQVEDLWENSALFPFVTLLDWRIDWLIKFCITWAIFTGFRNFQHFSPRKTEKSVGKLKTLWKSLTR